jgi:hypothetical protein
MLPVSRNPAIVSVAVQRQSTLGSDSIQLVFMLFVSRKATDKGYFCEAIGGRGHVDGVFMNSNSDVMVSLPVIC